MNDLLFSDATEQDAAAIASIEEVSFPVPWTQEMILSEMREPLSFFRVVFYQEKVVGYYGFLHIFDELHILNIAVDPTMRGRGVGSALITDLLKKARSLSVRALTLEVRESNAPAIRLYEKFGFKCAGVRPHYYTDKENALIYWLEL